MDYCFERYKPYALILGVVWIRLVYSYEENEVSIVFPSLDGSNVIDDCSITII